MTKLIKLCRLLVLVTVWGILPRAANSQVSPLESQNGFSLQKAVSLSSVQTGNIFTYTITFSIPGGSTNVYVYDNIPAGLVIDNVIVPASYSGNVPTVTTVSNTVQLFFPTVVGSISGSFQVNVHFPVDKGCNGERADNSATLFTEVPLTRLTTKTLSTTSIVNNPWRIQKYPTALPYIGGACPYGTVSDTIDYTIRIVKQWWTISGSATLYNISLQDIMPAGASVIPSSYTCSANLTGSSINAGGTISLPVGFILDATGNNWYTARFKIVYPPIPSGSCVTNKVTLNGNYFCNTPYSDSSQTSVKKLDSFPPNPVLNKWVVTNGNLPGCTGTYYIRVCNYGFGTLSGYRLIDNFPPCLTGVTPNPPPAGCTISGGPLNYVLRGPALGTNQCHTYSFNFTIGTGCGTSFTNTVTADSGFSASASAGVALLPNVATPCITKSICGPSAYTIGSIVRFRLRVQNIGGTPLSGTSIQDNLDNGNLQYVGNELYYSYPNPFAPCAPNNTTIPAGSTAWTGVTTAHNIVTGALKWNLDTIPVACGNVPYPACGFAYGLTAYYIEFSVKIKDTAGLGNLLNLSTIGGGNIVTPVSSSVTFVTNGVINYTVSKLVSNDAGANYSSSVTAPAGSSVRYKLTANNTGIGLINPVIVDLLPRDNGTSDNYILSPAARGSAFDIWYSSFVSSTHSFSSQSYSNVAGITTLPELGYTVNSAAPAWSPVVLSNTSNIKTQLSQALGLAPLNYIFDAQTDPAAVVNSVACNTWAIRGAAKYIINYAVSYPLQTPLESGKACVTTEQGSGCCEPYDFVVPKEICLNYNTQFCVKDSCKEPGNTYYWDFGDGSPGQTGKCVNHAYTLPGVYSVVVKWSNECGDHEKKFEVVVKECPCDIKVAFHIHADGLTITADGTATYSAQPAVLYVWDFGDGSFATGPIVTHTYSSPGAYTVKLTVYSIGPKGEICECKGECKTDIDVSPDKRNDFYCNRGQFPDDPQEKTAAAKGNAVTLKANPNPFGDNITVSFESAAIKTASAGGYQLEFANANGVVLQSRKLQSLDKTVMFDTRVYASGIYFIILKNASGQVQNSKVIKLK